MKTLKETLLATIIGFIFAAIGYIGLCISIPA
jgi:hypothetical protein